MDYKSMSFFFLIANQEELKGSNPAFAILRNKVLEKGRTS